MKIINSMSPDGSWPLRILSRNDMDYIFGDFEKIMKEVLRSSNEGKNTLQPRCDISETKDHFLASFDIPGVKKEDIKIEVQGNQLIISGERRQETRVSDNELSHHRERIHGKFERTFNLPTTVDSERIEAQYEDGVLNIAIPKAEVAKTRTIQIQSRQDSIFNKLLASQEDSSKELRDVRVS